MKKFTAPQFYDNLSKKEFFLDLFTALPSFYGHRIIPNFSFYHLEYFLLFLTIDVRYSLPFSFCVKCGHSSFPISFHIKSVIQCKNSGFLKSCHLCFLWSYNIKPTDKEVDDNCSRDDWLVFFPLTLAGSEWRLVIVKEKLFMEMMSIIECLFFWITGAQAIKSHKFWAFKMWKNVKFNPKFFRRRLP